MTDAVQIIAQGQGWICVDKPGGMSVHNDPGRDLISELEKRLGPETQVLQPVHRLDRETSGLIVLATDQDALARLSDLFARRTVIKRYRALVHGHFHGQDSGTWDTALTKSAGGRSDPRGRGKRVQSLTRYRVLDESPHYTLLAIELLTGRKHQIRRHAKLAGHPVVGDPRYGSPRALEFLKTRRQFYAMGLQSCCLEFKDRDRTVTLELPDLPPELARLFEADRM